MACRLADEFRVEDASDYGMNVERSWRWVC